MALRGETIGTAYVKVLADGSGFGDSVREDLRGLDGAFKQLGRTHSEAYQEGFEEQNEELGPKLVKGLEAGVRRNSGRFDAIGEQIGGDLFDPIDRQFKHRFGDLVGKQMSKDMREAFFRSGGSADVVDDFIEHLEANWEKATKTVDSETHKIETLLHNQARRLEQIEDQRADHVSRTRREEFEAAINRIRTLAAAEKEDETRRVKSERLRQQIERDTQTELKKSLASFRTLSRQIGQFHRSLDADRTGRRRLLDDLDKIGDRIRTLGGDTDLFERDFSRVHSALVRSHPALTRTINRFDKFGESIGKVFGKGSRNDFFNIFGRIVGFFVTLPALIPKAIAKVAEFGSVMAEAFAKEGFIGVMKVGGSAVAGLAASLVGLVVIMGLVITASGVMASAIMSLVGALTAMAGSLSFAVAGGLAVVAGALVPVIAGLGVAVLAVKNMDKETKKAFGSIGKAFKELGTEASQNIFDTPAKDAEALRKAVEGLGAITGPVSRALGGLLDEFIESLSDPIFVRFQNFLGRVLPGMVTSLGHIVGNLGAAFAGIFTAAAPSVQGFLTMIENITGKFAEWANSTKGKHEIKDFLDEAKESAEAVWDAIDSVIGLVGDLLGMGKDEGDNLFTSLADEVDRWRGKLEEAGKNGTLKQWFTDAGETAKKIGTMVTKLGEFIEELDTPENRQLVRDLADAFEAVLKVMRVMIATWKLFSHAMVLAYNAAIGPVLSNMLKAVAGILEKLADMFDILDKSPFAPAWIGKTAEALHHAADEADGMADSVKEIPETHTTTVNVVPPSQNTINRVNWILGGIKGRVTVPVAVAVTPGQNPNTPQDPRMTTGGISVGPITIITPTEDPAAVAAEVMNQFAALAYT